MGGFVRVECDQAVATIRLDRPPMNTINAAAQNEIAAAAEAVGKDPAVRDLRTGLEIERLNFAALFATEDQRAGIRSFIENGPGKATFTGR